MARYIDADKLKQRKRHIEFIMSDGKKQDEYDFVKFSDIDETPTADVREVKHAHWKEREEEVYGIPPSLFYGCSECGVEYHNVFMAACCAEFEKDTIQFHYCPYCGAKMDGKENEKCTETAE